MREHEHDSLEDFFRKAASRAEVTFNEDDWKKLEARLDAAPEDTAALTGPGRTAVTVAVGIILLILTGVWWTGIYDKKVSDVRTAIPQSGTELHDSHDARSAEGVVETEKPLSEAPVISKLPSTAPPSGPDTHAKEGVTGLSNRHGDSAFLPGVNKKNGTDVKAMDPTGVYVSRYAVAGSMKEIVPRQTEAILRELVRIPVLVTIETKQRATTDLPGAEEEDTGAAGKQLSAGRPRVSLLLSVAPDFSSTSRQYSSPGRAFGALLHYHFLNRWSIAAGVIKNNKQYTGNGEDYTPPYGYWKNFTNGVVPSSIDGSCSVIEFPLAIQYTIDSRPRHKWLVSAGTSSYLMLDEQYRYYFNEPNPGAKEGWSSKGTSRFYFNMINVGLAYEHQVIPGLMLGIEPYMKIPVEAIGWTQIRLFSTGASVTLRYQLIGRNSTRLSLRNRGPD